GTERSLAQHSVPCRARARGQRGVGSRARRRAGHAGRARVTQGVWTRSETGLPSGSHMTWFSKKRTAARERLLWPLFLAFVAGCDTAPPEPVGTSPEPAKAEAEAPEAPAKAPVPSAAPAAPSIPVPKGHRRVTARPVATVPVSP